MKTKCLFCKTEINTDIMECCPICNARWSTARTTFKDGHVEMDIMFQATAETKDLINEKYYPEFHKKE